MSITLVALLINWSSLDKPQNVTVEETGVVEIVIFPP